MGDIEEIYRRLHPKRFPFSPWERQLELSDLWPNEQQKFREMVSKIAREPHAPSDVPEKPERD